MRKGISPIISTVMLILISISAIYLVLNVVRPTVERAYEQAAMNEADQNMQLLDNLIREVASEGTGSSRTVYLKVSDGNYRVINTSGNFTGAVQFKIELKHSPFSAPMFRRVGNLKYSAGMNSVGLVGYWKFDEGIGTVANDSSSYNNDGTLYNGSVSCANPPTSDAGCPNWVDGNFGKALSFDGVDDYVEVPYSASLNPSQAVTVSAWINIPNTVGYKRWVSYSSETDYSPYQLKGGNNNDAVFLISQSDTSSDYISSGEIPLNTWVHAAGTYDGQKIRIYINGELRNSKDYPGTIRQIANQKLYFMTLTPSYGFQNGIIDEVCIYNRALGEEEIKENHDAKASNYQVVLEYSKIILTGNLRLGKGTHKLCIEKIGELSNNPLIKIVTC